MNKSDIAEAAKSVLETLLSLMGISASVIPSSEPLIEGEAGAATSVTLDIRGEDLGILIGRRGQTLSCLQYIVKLVTGHQTKTWLPIIIDVEGYKQRRYQSLRDMAQRIASQVGARRVSFTLKPMPAFERRIIHITLADNSDVTTESTGAGESRRVCIIPREPSD